MSSSKLSIINSASDGMQAVEKKINELKIIHDSAFKTSGEFDNNIKIRDVKDISALVRAFAYVSIKEEAYNRAADEMKLQSVPVFKINGYTAEEWKHDIKLAIQIAQSKETYDKLIAIKNRFQELMTNEDKFKILQQEMESLTI